MFRGEWYFSHLPFYLTESPLISNWSSKESNNIILEIINNSQIKKSIFVYKTNKEFIYKFEGVTHAQKEININHDIIKKIYALLNTPYKGYIFSYERLKD
jgi:NUMOD1 domain